MSPTRPRLVLLSRRPFTVTHHLVFTLHYGAALLIAFAVVIASGIGWLSNVALLLCAVYLVLAIRRAYDRPWFASALVALGLWVVGRFALVAIVVGAGHLTEFQLSDQIPSADEPDRTLHREPLEDGAKTAKVELPQRPSIVDDMRSKP